MVSVVLKSWRRWVGAQVSHVVIDEMDTMLKDGFGPDIKKLLTVRRPHRSISRKLSVPYG